jgi:hypothetical protein
VAEEVQIGNVGGDGVASEVTLQRLVQATEAMAKKSGIENKGAAAKLQALYNGEVKKSANATKEQSAATEDQTTATKSATQETNKFARSLGGAAGKGLGALAKSAFSLGKAFWNNETSVSAFAEQLPGIGKVLSPFASYVDESTEAFRNLSASGASFGNNITTMRNTAANMGMSLGELDGFITANSEKFAGMAGTVTEGATRFAAMNKNIKATGDFRNLKEMGFTVMEINEGMADYIDLQTRMGTVQGKSTQQLAAGSADYLQQIDRLAKVTGKTREEAEKALASQATDAGIRGMLNALGEGTEEFKNLQMSLALIDEVGGPAGEAMKDLIDGMPSTEETGKFLAMLGDAAPGVQAALKEIGEGADPQILLTALENSVEGLSGFASGTAAEQKQMIDSLRRANPEMGAMLDAIPQMMKVAGRTLEEAEAEQDARDTATQTMATFDDTMRDLSAALNKAFIESGVLTLITNGLNLFSTAITGITSIFTNFTTNLAEGGWISAITTALGEAITGIWNNAGVVGALVAGIAVLFAGKAAMGAMTKGIASKIGSLFGGGAGGGDTGGAGGRPGGGRGGGGGLGKSIGGIGSGIGKGLGGILKGLASGIAAFANPLVLAGGVNIGLVILGVGAAVAGATWMVGAALPKFAEGMKSFEDLDGQALIDAGKGIGAVALGMAAFGAGSAVSGLGNLVGSVTNGIAGLFGAEDPLEKIKKFQDYKFDAAAIENNANAIVAYSKGMAALGAGEALSGIGAAVGAVGGAIAGLFGAENPLDKIKTFGEYQFNTPGIIANAGAVAAYAVAMKDFPTSPAASVFGAFKGGLVSLLGGETDPMAPIKRFGEYQFNTANIIANAGAVAAYAIAIKDFPTSPAAGVFGAFKGGLVSLLGGETDPMAPIKRFGEYQFNTANIIANAGAVAAYAVAMKDFPTSPAASVFTTLKDGIIGLLGGEVDPFAPMMKFGDLKLNSAGITTNAGAVSSFADAMSNMPEIDVTRTGGVFGAIAGWFAGDEVMPWDSVKAFGDANINAQGVSANAAAINAMSTSLNSFSLEKLDTTGIISYTSAMESLVEVLGELNDALSADNQAGFGTGTNAGDVVSKMDTIGSGGGGGSDQLNTTMQRVEQILTEIRDFDETTAKNTRNIIGSNLAQGNVSNVSR